MFETLAAGFGRGASRRRRWGAAIARSGLFDEAFYRGQGPRLGARPALDHFVRSGNAEAFWPNPLFDPQWYLDTYRDVRPTGQNALLHYLQDGEPEGRQPNEMFNPRWYAARNGLPSPGGALRHYLEVGRGAGLKPCATFTPRAYVNANRDLGIAVADAFAHHLRRRAERRRALGGRGGRADQPWQSDAYGYVAPLRPDDLDARVADLAARPTFSIVLAARGPAPRHLEGAIASVRAQWYPRWELIVAMDADPAAALDRIGDPRITHLRPPEGGPAAAVEAALLRAGGDYVVSLDGDDALTPDCLYALAGAIAETGADYLYSDEDEIDGRDRASAPFFKPGWSPDALMSLPYARRVACARRALIEACGGPRAGLDGAEEYDLVLRLTERAGRIEHVPRVLYHRRRAADPPAAGAGAAVRRVKEDALARRGLSGSVEPVAALPGAWRVNYHPRPGTLASVIVPTKNNGRLATALVASIYERTTHPSFEVILIDNGSTEPDTLAALAALARDGGHPGLRVRQDSAPFNYSALNNAGAAAARGAVLVFLNDDMEIVTPDWLERLVGYAQVPHVGAVGAKLLYPTGEIQHCGIVNLAHGPGHAFYREEPGPPRYHGRDTLDYDWAAVTGACLAIERAKFDAVGGFDEGLPIAYNDIDLCFRLLEAGRYNVVCQAVELIHHESISRGSDDSPAREARLAREARRLYARHPRFLGHDPFHSPNLHPDDVRFTPNPN